MAVTKQQVAELYVATFNRAPDADGLDYWVNLSGLTIDQIAQSFFDQPETQTLYPSGTTNSAFVTSIYQNLFNRAPDAPGLAYWVANLDNGTMTRDVMILAMKNGALADTNTNLVDKAIILNKAEVALYYADTLGLQGTDYTLEDVTEYSSSVTAAKAEVDNISDNGGDTGATGTTYTLTAAANVLTGTNGNDTFNGTDVTSVLGSLNGGTGTDTFNYIDTTGAEDVIADTGLLLTSIETLNIRSIGAAEATTTSVTGLNNLNVTQATSVDVTAAATTAVSVSGATGAIAIDGGKNLTVTTAGTGVTIGATTGAAGTVTVTDTAQAASSIDIDGGTSVTVSSTGSTTGSAINIGQAPLAASPIPTGAVSVSVANTAVAGTDATTSDVTIDGGSTVTVTQTATSTLAAADTTGSTVTQGDVTITAGTATTNITVNEAASTAEVTARVAVAAVSQTKTLTFSAMTAGQTLIIDGLTFTAAKALTATEVAAAFAGLSASDTQDSGGSTANGSYTGATSANWTSGANSGATVVFTVVTAGATPVLTVNTGTGTAPTVVTSAAGNAATAARTGVLGVENGTIVIDDNATAASVTTVSVDGYGNASTIGATNSMDALTTLSLANSGSTGTAGETDASMTVHTAKTALDLTLNNVQGAVNLDGTSATITTLNLTTATANSATALTAAAVETLNVAGTNAVDLSTGTLTNLVTVTVAGSAGLTLDADDADKLTSLTSTSTGAVTAVIDGDIATYSGGAGVDTVSFTATTNVAKAITLGAGNDTLTLGANTIGAGSINGGDGTDTISMTAATAVTASGNATFAGKVTNFEQLTLTGATGAQTVAADVLGNYNYVSIASAVAGSATTLTGLTSGATIALNDNTNVSTTATITNAATATADVLNIAISATNPANSVADSNGTVTAANVETVNISVNDGLIQTPTNVAPDTQSLTLIATSAKTINVSGDTALNLTTAGNTAVTAINASSMTGALTVTAAGTVSTTITGGTGNDNLTASLSSAAAAQAQVSTITLTDGTVTGLGVNDTMSVVVGGTTFTSDAVTTATSTMDTVAANLAGKINANAAYTASYDAATDKITITAASAGTPFTLASYAVNDLVGTNATGTALTYNEGAVNAAKDKYTIDLVGTVLDTSDVVNFTINGATVTAYTATGDNVSAGTIATALIGSTITIDSKVYNVTAGGNGTTVVLESADVFDTKGALTLATVNNASGGASNYVAATNAGAITVTTAGAQDVDTVVVTNAFAVGKLLDKGDVISISVDTDGAGAGAATTVSYIVTADGMDFDTAMTNLAAAVATDTSNAATATYTVGADTLTVTDAASTDANGLVLSALTVTDVVTDGVVNATGSSAAFATTTANISSTPAADTLIGGAGNDTLVAGTLATLTGGTGNDTFDMITQLSNVNSYSTITDLSSGDVIKTGSTVFKAAAVTLASTAVFQDYANEAIKTSANTDVSWFQYDGNTYVVQNDSASTSFVNGTDDIIKINGLVDLSTASFNTMNGTIEIA